MVNTKNRSTPVVDKKEEKGCGCGCADCTCGDCCSCGCNSGKTFWKCTTMLVSAIIISGAVLFQPVIAETFRPHRPMPVAPRVSEPAFQEWVRKNPKLLADTLIEYQTAELKKAKKAAPRKFSLNDLEAAETDLVKSILDDPSNYSLGNKNGKFVIIEFFDYQCGWCKRTNKGLEEAIASGKAGNIRWVPVDTPIFGEASETIARYVLAAGEQGKYAEMHKAVGEASGKLNEDSLLEIAKALKLDTKKLKAAANGQKIKDKMAANKKIARRLNINGVPMLIIDGRINPGALFGDNLEEVIKLSNQK